MKSLYSRTVNHTAEYFPDTPQDKQGKEPNTSTVKYEVSFDGKRDAYIERIQMNSIDMFKVTCSYYPKGISSKSPLNEPIVEFEAITDTHAQAQTIGLLYISLAPHKSVKRKDSSPSNPRAVH